MNPIHALLERKLAALDTLTAVVLPGGQRFGAEQARVTLRLQGARRWRTSPPARSARVAQDYVEGQIEFDGSVRDLMAIASQMIDDDPTRASADRGPLAWWRRVVRRSRSRAAPCRDRRAPSAVPLRRVGRLLRSLARPDARLLLRLLPRSGDEPGRGAAGQNLTTSAAS